jgi:two-component system response regulator AtoC
VDARVLVATNRNLEKAMKNGQFREDLYYRLNVVKITIPPLRERKDEIPLFADHFVKLYGIEFGKNDLKPSWELMSLFNKYNWPGNVRELENTIQRLLVLGDEAPIIEGLSSNQTTKQTLFVKNNDNEKRNENKEEITLRMMARKAAEDIERKAIFEALNHTNWNRKKAAELLNMKYKALIYKINRLGLKD